MDHTICRTLLSSLKKQGIQFHLSVKVTEGKVSGDGVTLGVEIDGKVEQFPADVVLVAIGRRPYSSGLGLKEVGIAQTPRGFVEINDLFQTLCQMCMRLGILSMA